MSAEQPDAPGRGVSLNGHDFGPYHYAGMGNTERECSRCHFRQDEQLEDERVPPCTSGRVSSPHPKAEHRITITLDGDYPAHGRVECSGDDTSFCHLSCPHGCERWTNDTRHPCGPDEAPHTLTPSGYCNVIESIEGAGVLDCHVGKQVVPGPRALIEVEWDEGYLWRFADV